ncbi:MAG: hypothetical protein ACE5IR_06405 [bacterium]
MNSNRESSDWIDGSLYPEQSVPEKIATLSERIDFLVRLCAAWDFGLPPKSSALQEVLSDDWKEAVEHAEFLTSCAYHLLRELHGLPSLSYMGPQFPDILNDPYLRYV